MTTTPKGKNLWWQIMGIVRLLAPWVAAGCVILALLPRANELKLCLSRMSAGYLAASFSLCVVYRFLNAGIWSWILEALGHPVQYVLAIRAWLTSESLRWLPGSVWGFCSRIDAARMLGVPTMVASLSMPVELTITVASWGVIACAGILASGVGNRLFSVYRNWLLAMGVTGVTVFVALKSGWPLLIRQPRFRKALEHLQAVIKLQLDVGSLIRSGLFYTALNGVNGLGFWLILAGMGYQHVVGPTLAVGVNAAGWLIGFFALGVPGGIGVREAGAALLLSPIMPWQEAALAAALWRVIQIVAELGSLLPCLFIGGGGSRSPLDSLAEERS